MTAVRAVRSEEFGEVCRVVVGELPRTGASISPEQVLLTALVLLAVGAAVLVVLRRRGIGASVGALSAVTLLALAAVPAPDASAAQAEVTYGEGCGLLEVIDAQLSDDLADGLLPGDRTVAVRATVINRFSDAVEVRLGSEASDDWEDLAELTPGFVGRDADVVTLGAGKRLDVELEVALPLELGDDAQAVDGSVALVITSAQQAP